MKTHLRTAMVSTIIALLIFGNVRYLPAHEKETPTQASISAINVQSPSSFNLSNENASVPALKRLKSLKAQVRFSSQPQPAYVSESSQTAESEPERKTRTTQTYGDVIPAQYGKAYGVLSCAAIDLSENLIWGDDQALIDAKNGVCEYANSPQVGYAGCHLLAAHNNGAFGKLESIKIGDLVSVETDYGNYVYSVDSCQDGTVTADAGTVIADDGTVLISLDDPVDRLYMYTCYPFGYFGATDKRYVVRATLVE